MILQPLTWKEHDDKKYVVDVYGRTHEGDIARVRLGGYKPYFYIRELTDFTKIKTKNGFSPKFYVEEVLKQDVIKGFNSLKKEKFYKLSFETLWGFKLFASELKKSANSRIYESNFPPYLKLIHERNISPSSPFEFNFTQKRSGTYDYYEIQYSVINPTECKIPLYIMCYDLEVYSESGFPQSSDPKSEIMQIGVSTRWTDNLLEPVERFVLVSGNAVSDDPSLKYICCSGERDLLMKFQQLIKVEEPDIITGYNTFGFDDGYLYDRFEKYHLEIDLGRETTQIVSKTFELASGKYAVRYLDMNGRLSLDLLLYARREFNLDSYKLDNVAGVFLRDKVQNIIIISGAETRMFEIHTKSTRGLFKGNYVKFDIVTNTSNPYANGKKFFVKEIFENKFIIELSDENYLNTFHDLSQEERKKLEWSFCKDDISIKQIMDSHHGTQEQKGEVARYCIQDCDLVLTLLAKLDVLTNSRGMADVCKVPLEYIFANRGQGIRIYSAVLYEASKQDQIIQTQECAEGDISYEGAIVIEPKIGMYLDNPIAVLDYNSLYPSNMIAYNLSPDTLVYVKTYDEHGRKIEKESYEVLNIEEIKKNFRLDEISYDHHGGRQSCGYVQEHEGLIPRTLKLLLKMRKDTRKLMETEQDESQKSVLNGLQLAYKTVANSIYGQTGSRTSPIRKVEVAACTTAIGRERLLFAKKIAEEEFCGEVVYGDSVTSYTPVTLKINDQIEIKSIEELGYDMKWVKCLDSDKEYCELQNVFSWTDKGWTEIKRVIRHKLASHKKIIRVLTHGGSVDVTDDHSLLKLDGTEISPKNLNIGDSLLHHEIPQFNSTEGNFDELRIMGFFMGDGSCGIYECPSGIKSSWALNNADMKLLEFYKSLCEKVYPNLKWKINNTIESSGVYKLVPTCDNYGSIKNFVKQYRELMYVDKRKNIPTYILNGSSEMAKSFWDGLYDADGDKTGITRIDQKHETTCAQIAYLATKLNYKISINTRMDKQHIYRITCCKRQRKEAHTIKKMYEIPYEGYVYDLTTENHHFQAGIGSMIVHNTDSIFVDFKKPLAETIDIAKIVGKRISALCRIAHKIDYEKTFFPFLLFCRKRYAGLMYEDDITKCKRKFMGISLKRRDSAPIVKDIYGGALDILLEQRSLKNAESFVKESLVKVLKNEFPIEKFIITKQLRDDYKNPAQIAHRVLADRMTLRDAGNIPQVGERLAFIYVAGRSGKQGERIENIDYVKQKNLKPDTDFYITNQIQNPLAQLFALGIEQLSGYVKKSYPEFPDLSQEEQTLKILSLKEKELDSILFTSAQYLRKEKRGPLDSFFTRK
jgi:DNA polymerase elongation subunit (family B)